VRRICRRVCVFVSLSELRDSINDRIKKGEKMDESIKDEIRALLNDLESDRIERTISTTNTDKFGQAICAFANDLPNHQMPGFLFLGVLDNGEIQGVDVTDELLKNVAAIRTDGNIQPQPSMIVEKVSMEEGEIVMVKVDPSVFPPSQIQRANLDSYRPA
jgi:Predicted transcriptional regulator containing an HTH domain and an uncharacterized domain shared with the mammalian protein Schlafen